MGDVDAVAGAGAVAADGGGAAVRVFISYAHEPDVPGHAEAVRDLWVWLRSCGIDARLDRVAAGQRQDWALWMADQIRAADHILIIASPAYKVRAEGRAGTDEGRGVQWEARLIRDAFYRDQAALQRFLPVVLPGGRAEDIPDFLAPSSSTWYQVNGFDEAGTEELLRLLLAQPAETEPPLGTPPVFETRDHTLPTPPGPGSPVTARVRTVTHGLVLRIGVGTDGRWTTAVELAGTVLGERTAAPPRELRYSWESLHHPDAADRQRVIGQALWTTLFDEATSRRLLELIDHSPFGTTVDIVVYLPEELAGIPVELLHTPDGRPAVTLPGVALSRRLVGVDRAGTAGLAGPLKILAAVAAPDETTTANAPLDVEAEMQALLDAVTDLDLAIDLAIDLGADTAGGGVRAQVRILEVASLTEIGAALGRDQYHVLHLSAHGSPTGIELEDEDGRPQPVDTDRLIATLRAGRYPPPLVVLSSCSGAATAGTDGLAAALVRRGADRVLAMQAPISDTVATELGHHLYRALAADPDATVSGALARARHTLSQNHAGPDGARVRAQLAVATLLAAGDDPPLRSAGLPEEPLARSTEPPAGKGVRELPIGHLIGRRAALRATVAALRRSPADRDRVGAWGGVVLRGVGGIGKTALAGRALARMRADGAMVVEHIGAWNPPALISAVADTLTDTAQDGLAAQLRDPGIDDTAKLRAILQLVRRTRMVVLFDDFEQNLTTDSAGSAPAFADPGFAEVFGHLVDAAADGTGRLLVTCRYPVPDADLLLDVELPALSAAELRRLFLRLPALRALPVEDRRVVARTIGGHPRLIEFLDVLLREGAGAGFIHITRKLRDLARTAGLDVTARYSVADGVERAVLLGSRDIVLDTLREHLTPTQREALLQAAMSTAPFILADLVHALHGGDPTPEQTRAVAVDAERLAGLTLLGTAPPGELVVHPWISAALLRNEPGERLVQRHRRAAAMRLHRLQEGRGGFDDLVELIRHFAGCGDYDAAVAVAFEGCDLLSGEVAIAALLAEAVPLIPTEHPDYLPLADRECEALLRTGLVTATTDRRARLLLVAQERVAADPGNAGYQRDLSISRNKLGDLAVAAGDSSTAERHYRAGLTIAERLAAADPGNAGYQRDLSISRNKLGDLARAAGDSSTAEQHYRAGLTIAERLAAADPGNADYQRDLSISRNKLGDLARAAGDSTTAEQHYRAGLTIRERLAAADPGNADYQRDLSISRNKLGDLARAAGDSTTAEQHYRAGLTIRERLAAADPGNADYQRDLSASRNKLGDLARAAGDSTTAEQHYRAGLTIAERLAAADPGNADYQRDLSASRNKLGDLARAAGDSTTAEQHYRAGLTIRERLAAADPGNADYQRDLSVSRERLGDLARAAGDSTTAEQHYRAGLTIRERLAAADPGNADYQRDLSISRNKLGDLARAAGDSTTAEQHYRAGLTIAERLAAADPGNADYQRDLSISHERLGDLARAAGDVEVAAEQISVAVQIRWFLHRREAHRVDLAEELATTLLQQMVVTGHTKSGRADALGVLEPFEQRHVLTSRGAAVLERLRSAEEPTVG